MNTHWSSITFPESLTTDEDGEGSVRIAVRHRVEKCNGSWLDGVCDAAFLSGFEQPYYRSVKLPEHVIQADVSKNYFDSMRAKQHVLRQRQKKR
mgnify:CR=1 FL=1